MQPAIGGLTGGDRRVKWSAKLGRFAGIDVYVHVTFLLLLGWVGLALLDQHRHAGGVAAGLTLILLLFLCVCCTNTATR